jgi:hypothetical protein
MDIDACQGRYCPVVFERLWRLKEAIIVFSIAGMAVLLAPTALWVRAVGFAAATVVYWRYVWKYKGVREETAAALERERERQRRAADDDE